MKRFALSLVAALAFLAPVRACDAAVVVASPVVVSPFAVVASPVVVAQPVVAVKAVQAVKVRRAAVVVNPRRNVVRVRVR